MLFIISERNCPFFNLALEEYCLRHKTRDDFFVLYLNDRSVICGKHQNLYAEINYPYIKRNNITVGRRISGGGTVYHDPGNLNYSFITNSRDGETVNFRKYTQPVLDFLHKLKLDARLTGKSDLVIEGRKISGNAAHVFKNRSIHHGTLLFSSDIDELNSSLANNSSGYKGKWVQSNPGSVTNIRDHLQTDLDIKSFRDMFLEHVMNLFSGSSIYRLSDHDIFKVNKLVDEKYSQWDWIFGYSPPYTFEKLIGTKYGTVEIKIEVKNGIILNSKVEGEIFGKKGEKEPESVLTGLPHDEEVIKRSLASNYGLKPNDFEPGRFAEKLF